jgi:hypothetical protein
VRAAELKITNVVGVFPSGTVSPISVGLIAVSPCPSPSKKSFKKGTSKKIMQARTAAEIRVSISTTTHSSVYKSISSWNQREMKRVTPRIIEPQISQVQSD